jgi:DNA-binding NarL/FixJ family response regulator
MPKRVLVVDDHAALRYTICQSFSDDNNIEVCGEAENGQEAIEKAQELRPDLIVMDFSMTVMNGIEAARALNLLMPAIPVIIFSQHCEVLPLTEGQSAGISAFVPKSAHFSVLINQSRRLCGCSGV